MTREEALKELKKPAYDSDQIKDDFQFIANKLDISVGDLERYFNAPNKTYREYRNQEWLYKIGANVLRAIGKSAEVSDDCYYRLRCWKCYSDSKPIRAFVGGISSCTVKNQLEAAKKIILPGVGAFDDTMKRLNGSGMRETLDEKVLGENVPCLGVCIGMQIMTQGSEEEEQGLGWFADSKVIALDVCEEQEKPHLPHMGWNSVKPLQNNPILDDLDFELGFYFAFLSSGLSSRKSFYLRILAESFLVRF